MCALHAVSQSGQGGDQLLGDEDIDEDDDDETLDDEDEDEAVDEDAEFPEPGQDEDQWTDDEELLAHGPMVNTGKVAWYVASLDASSWQVLMHARGKSMMHPRGQSVMHPRHAGARSR